MEVGRKAWASEWQKKTRRGLYASILVDGKSVNRFTIDLVAHALPSVDQCSSLDAPHLLYKTLKFGFYPFSREECPHTPSNPALDSCFLQNN